MISFFQLPKIFPSQNVWSRKLSNDPGYVLYISTPLLKEILQSRISPLDPDRLKEAPPPIFLGGHPKQWVLFYQLFVSPGTSRNAMKYRKHVIHKAGRSNLTIFIGPESDHWLCLSLTH